MWPCTVLNTQPLLCTITLQPVTRQPLPQDHYWCCSAIGWCHRGPHLQATSCQWVTVCGPAQPLVSTAVGLFPKCQWVTVSGPAQPLVSATGGPYPISGPAQPLVGAKVCPSPKRPIVNEWLLVVLPSHWSVPQWAPTLLVVLLSRWLVPQWAPTLLVVLLSHWSVPQWAPPPRDQLSMSDC